MRNSKTFDEWFVPAMLLFVAAMVLLATPRAGRIVNLGRLGNIAAFGGRNWLQSKYTITGTFNVPDSDLVIDYSIDQESRDNLTLLVGYNWDFNRRVSWGFEYNGFIGSREAFIFSLNVRF